MASQKDKEGLGPIKTAVIGGIFALLAACVGGFFLILNTLIEKGNLNVIPSAQTPTAVIATAISQSTTQAISTPIVVSGNGNSPSSNIPPLIVDDKTNSQKYTFDFSEVNDPSSYCPGAYIKTDMAEILYQITVPPTWVVIIDSWKADWSSGNYQNNGILIISGDWQGSVKINTGAICGVPAEQTQTALQYRRNVTGNDGRPEYTLP